MANTRLQREVDTRATSERPTQWAPAELLPEQTNRLGMRIDGFVLQR